MDAKDRLFVDGIASVRFTEGLIRMTLFNNVPGENGEEKPAHAGELIMSQQAFLKAYGTMENLIGQLSKAGIIKRVAKDETKNEEPASPAGSADASPNFQ